MYYLPLPAESVFGRTRSNVSRGLKFHFKTMRVRGVAGLSGRRGLAERPRHTRAWGAPSLWEGIFIYIKKNFSPFPAPFCHSSYSENKAARYISRLLAWIIFRILFLLSCSLCPDIRPAEAGPQLLPRPSVTRGAGRGGARSEKQQGQLLRR